MLHEAVNTILSDIDISKFGGVALQETALPYMIHRLNNNLPLYTKDNDRKSLVDRAAYQVVICADTYAACERFAEQSRLKMESAAGAYMGIKVKYIRLIDEKYLFDEASQAHVFNQNFDIVIER